MWIDASGSAPPGSQSLEQRSIERRSSLLDMSSRRAQETAEAIGLCNLQDQLRGHQPSQPSQAVRSCDVCGRVEPGLRNASLAGNRVGKLRAYGNAIVAEQARIWIEMVMEELAA
jgi:hypothetical protein